MSNIAKLDPTDKRPLVALCVPAGDRVHREFMETLWALGRGARNHRQGLCIGQSSIVAQARNMALRAAFEVKADYAMFLDSDLILPWNTIDRLLAHQKEIVGATYVRRGPPFDNMGHVVNEAERNSESGLVEMTHIPTGCLLIKMEVFYNWKAPWFRFDVDEEHGIVRGEDFVFSEMARRNGHHLWCDVDLSKETGHMYQYPLRVEDAASRGAVEEFKRKVAANG